MTKRKFGLLITSVVATGAILAACGDDKKDSSSSDSSSSNSEDNFSVAMVTDVGGVDDKSFNQSAWEGVQQFGKDNGLERGNGGYDYLQSKSDADYSVNINNLIRRDFDLVFGVGYMMDDAITEAAADNPDKYFAIIDSEIDAENVASIMFREQEGAFLAGVVAASMSKTGKIGFVGGSDIPVINRFHAGYIEGAKAVNPDIEVQVNYTGVFDDASKGKIAANAMYSSGVDIIFHAAGATGNGVFSEAKERKAKDPNADVWVIGVDADQYAEGQVDANTNITLTSMLKTVSASVVDIADKAQKGEFPGGKTTVYGLAEGGISLADSRGAISDDVLKLVDEYTEKISNGEIKVPESAK